MYKIVKKTRLCGNVCEYVVEAAHPAPPGPPGRVVLLRF